MDDAQFYKWFDEHFGYCYGSGVPEIVNLLLLFFSVIPWRKPYKHTNIEVLLGVPAAWLLINLFCIDRVVEYGVSPRCGWLTEKGNSLRVFMCAQGKARLLEIIEKGDDNGL